MGTASYTPLQPSVSVLLPCYQAELFVERAIQSVIGQTFPNWELVITDNASSDRTFDIARAHSARDRRIRAFRNERNIGPVRNWARAAELAGGRLAGLLFADDWYEPSFLQRAVPAMESAAIGFFYSAVAVRTLGPSGTVAPRARVVYQLSADGRMSTMRYLEEAYFNTSANVPFSPGCALFRASDLARWLRTKLPDETDAGFMRHGAGPDLQVYLQAATEYKEFAFLREPAVNFLSHDLNLSKDEIVGSAYAMVLKEFYETRLRGVLPESLVRANLYWRLRRDGRRRALVRPRSLAEWARVGILAGARAVERLRAVLIRAHGDHQGPWERTVPFPRCGQ